MQAIAALGGKVRAAKVVAKGLQEERRRLFFTGEVGVRVPCTESARSTQDNN